MARPWKLCALTGLIGLLGTVQLGGSAASASGRTQAAAGARVVPMIWQGKQLHPHIVDIASGDTLQFCNHDPFYNEVFTATRKYPYDRFHGPLVAPGSCWSRQFFNRESFFVKIALYDMIHAQSKAYVVIAPGIPTGFRMTLQVSDTHPPQGGTVTLTATLNKTVINTPYAVRIREVTTGYVIQACGSSVTLGPTVTVCVGHTSWNKPESYSFRADVEERNDPSHVTSYSNTVTVSWQ